MLEKMTMSTVIMDQEEDDTDAIGKKSVVDAMKDTEVIEEKVAETMLKEKEFGTLEYQDLIFNCLIVEYILTMNWENILRISDKLLLLILVAQGALWETSNLIG